MSSAIRLFRTQVSKTLARYSVWFVALCFIYSVLLVIGWAVPQSAVEANRQQSIQFLNNEGTSYTPLYGNTRLDNFSDLVMLRGCAGSSGGGSIFHAFNFYSRYWNGWFILVKPLLLLGNITVVRVVQSGVFLLLLGTALIMISRKLGYACSMAFLLALLPARLDIVAVSLQYSHVFWIMLVAVIWLCHGKRSRVSMLLGFFVIGSVTNYIDLLTAPVLTLVVPLAVAQVLMFNTENAESGRVGRVSSRRFLTFPVLSAMNWGCGYALTWGMKWLLSTLITGENVFADAARKAASRSHGAADSDPDMHPTFIAAMQRIWQQFIYRGDVFIYAGVMVVVCVAVACLLVRRGAVCDKAVIVSSFKNTGLAVASLLLTALIPIVWVLGFTQHTWVHGSFMTHRILCGTLLCIFFIIGLWLKCVVCVCSVVEKSSRRSERRNLCAKSCDGAGDAARQVDL